MNQHSNRIRTRLTHCLHRFYSIHHLQLYWLLSATSLASNSILSCFCLWWGNWLTVSLAPLSSSFQWGLSSERYRQEIAGREEREDEVFLPLPPASWVAQHPRLTPWLDCRGLSLLPSCGSSVFIGAPATGAPLTPHLLWQPPLVGVSSPALIRLQEPQCLPPVPSAAPAIASPWERSLVNQLLFKTPVNLSSISCWALTHLRLPYEFIFHFSFIHLGVLYIWLVLLKDLNFKRTSKGQVILKHSFFSIQASVTSKCLWNTPDQGAGCLSVLLYKTKGMHEAVSSILLLQALVSHNAPAGQGAAQGRQEPRRENTEGDTPSWWPEMCHSSRWGLRVLHSRQGHSPSFTARQAETRETSLLPRKVGGIWELAWGSLRRVGWGEKACKMGGCWEEPQGSTAEGSVVGRGQGREEAIVSPFPGIVTPHSGSWFRSYAIITIFSLQWKAANYSLFTNNPKEKWKKKKRNS